MPDPTNPPDAENQQSPSAGQAQNQPIAGPIAMLTAGAGGMYCGSCLHDNMLAAALQRMSVDACLIPMYTPIRTDTDDVSMDRVFFGGINVYLQQKIRWAVYLPGFVERLLDHPGFLRWVTSRNMNTDASQLGEMTLSMLQGSSGRQRKEVTKLCNWLQSSFHPSLVTFSNILTAGCAPAIKQRLKVPILITLQGDDVFLDGLPESDRAAAIAEIRRIAESVDGFLTHSEFYRQRMAAYFDLPIDRFHIVPLGVDTTGFDNPRPQRSGPPTVGYLAKLAPEKGLHLIIDAVKKLRSQENLSDVRLAIAGWSGGQHAEYARKEIARARNLLGNDSVEHLGTIDRQQKINFLKSIDVLSVPSPYPDPKGLYVLESLACGTPVVQPNHGAFPELLASTGGGRLFEPGNIDSLAKQFQSLLTAPDLCRQLGETAQAAVASKHSADTVAAATWETYRGFLS